MRRDRDRQAAGRALIPFRLALGTLCFFGWAGCVGVPVLPSDGSGSHGGGAGGGGGGGGGRGDSPTPVTARLIVSNPTPGLGEELVLTCAVSPIGAAALTYSFEPADRLTIDSRQGTARFIVTDADIGVSFSFRCTATDGDSTDVRSPVLVVIPS